MGGGVFNIYDNLSQGEGTPYLSLFFAIIGMAIILFLSFSLKRDSNKMKNVAKEVPYSKLKARRKTGIYAYLILIFGALFIICLILGFIILGPSYSEGNTFKDTLVQNSGFLITLAITGIFFIVASAYYYIKLKKFKKQYRVQIN